ncbi:hypothetical protein ACKWTF_015213 [Chironomus riparius]
MALTCKFEDQEYTNGVIIYACKIKYQSIPSKILKVRGRHLQGKTNDDVEEVRFVKCNIPVVPAGLKKIFPKMNDLSVWKSNLKYVCNKDLIEYRHLKELHLFDNKIEFVPGNLFEGFQNLEQIGLNDNKLQMIEPNLLFSLDKLKVCDISDNPRYKTNYSIYDEDDSNATFNEVKAEIAKVFADHVDEHLQLKKEFMEELSKRNEDEDFCDDSSSSGQPDYEYRTSAYDQENPYGPKYSLISDIKTHLYLGARDFKIIITEREFDVHKFLLAARSDTLYNIFLENPQIEELKLVDISEEMFEIILKFLYTDELPGDDGTNYLELFAATGKLRIDLLMNHAANKIKEKIDENNALDILKLSNRYNHFDLRIKAYDVIKSMYPDVDFQNSWSEDLEKLTKVLNFIKKKEEVMQKFEAELKDLA